jgi:hypothetical protein
MLRLIVFILFSFQPLSAIEVTIKDLRVAQKKINQSPYFGRERTRIIKNEKNQKYPHLNVLVLNTTPEDKECCIISYASYNKTYPQLLEFLLGRLKDTFKGHVLYRIGGWPNMENGCLAHSDCPYGFKACAFQEAYDLGYKKILWLDSLLNPLKDLTPLFDAIEKNTAMYRYDAYFSEKFINRNVLEAFNLTFDEVKSYKHMAAGIFGLNFHKPLAVEFLKAWHESEVTKKRGYFNHIPEQIPLTILLRQFNLDECGFHDPYLLVIGKVNPQDQNFFFEWDPTRKYKPPSRWK